MRMRNLILIMLILISFVGLRATTYTSITIDADTSDFEDDELVWNDSSSDCWWDFNELYRMYITWDRNKLYIGADFLIEEANSLSFYFDFGLGYGAYDLGTVAWKKFFYAEGWQCNFSVNISGNGTNGIYRIYGDASEDDITNDPRIVKQVNLASGMYEIAIPWDVIYTTGFPEGATMGVVCTLTGYRGWDGADAMPDQSNNEPDGDGEYDPLDTLYYLNLDANGDGVPEEGWHPNTNSGEGGSPPYVSCDADVTTGNAPLTVHFTGIGNDPDGGTVTYSWNFGDGETSTEQNPTHTYQSPGNYVATLVVTDDEGMSSEPCQININVTQTGVDNLILDLKLSKEQPNCFQAGDLFELSVDITNPNSSSQNGDLYVVLDVYGSYYFAPTWSQNLDSIPIQVNGNDTYSNTLLSFTWPSGAGSASGIFFYSVVTFPNTFDLFSNLDSVQFCFE